MDNIDYQPDAFTVGLFYVKIFNITATFFNFNVFY